MKLNQSPRNTLISFPCNFPIKVIAENDPLLYSELIQVTKQYIPQFHAEMLSKRESSSANFVAFTLNAPVTSKVQLDALYCALTSHPKVKMVL